MIKAVMFDFGGVLAEEGFREGLKSIGEKNGLDPQDFFVTAGELVYQTGYVTGGTDEARFWKAVREKTGIAGVDTELRAEILGRFVLRPEMLKLVEEIRSTGISTAILSDQTNWLHELDRKHPFSHHFDYVFNSFELKKGKRDPSIFRDVCSVMGLRPEELVFVDDNRENVNRALAEGLCAILFRDIGSLRSEIKNLLRTQEQTS